MSILVNIAFRNLVRQKRRSLLLGIAIAFGACILILSNAFSHGISNVLFERIVKFTNGHAAISFMKNGNMMSQIFHDADRINAVIKKEAPEALRGGEEAIGVFGRALGNGTADNVILVGVDLKGKLSKEELDEFESNFKFIQGTFESLKNKEKGTPVVLAEQKATTLKVKIGDYIKVRFTGANNQTASAKLVVAGIFKPANVFMSSPIFLEISDIRSLAGYGPHDLPSMQINMKDPQKNAKKVADRLYAALKPGLGVIEGAAQCKTDSAQIVVLGLKGNKAAHALLVKNLKLSEGDSTAACKSDGVIASWSIARALNAGVGDTVRCSWVGKFDSAKGSAKFIITALADSVAPLPQNSLLVNDRDFYRSYYMPLPAQPSAALVKRVPDSSSPFYAALAPEYTLLKRCATTQEFTKSYRELSQQRVKGVVVSVQSMYETASAIINVEMVLNIITGVVGAILFFVILIGVINTLRMTVRERTREIGTVRAIGMQRGDVLRIFVYETSFLALIASIAGTGLAFLAMYGLSSFAINAGDNPMGMLLVNGRLYFAPTIHWTIIYNVLIVAIAAVTAYFPARRASRLSASTAMRHYE